MTCNGNSTSVTLLCSVVAPAKAEYSWKGPNVFTQDGNSVDITNMSLQSQDIYYCIAKNELGTKEKGFTLNDCSHGNAFVSLLLLTKKSNALSLVQFIVIALYSIL